MLYYEILWIILDRNWWVLEPIKYIYIVSYGARCWNWLALPQSRYGHAEVSPYKTKLHSTQFSEGETTPSYCSFKRICFKFFKTSTRCMLIKKTDQKRCLYCMAFQLQQLQNQTPHSHKKNVLNLPKVQTKNNFIQWLQFATADSTSKNWLGLTFLEF